MSSITEIDPPLEPSARTLRGRFRSAEAEASRLRVLEAVASALAEEPQLRTALALVVAHILKHWALDGGLVLLQEGGALTVQAAIGPVLPVGAQIPVGGALATALRPPMQPALRTHIESRLRVGKHPEVALEILLPLRFTGRALGLLVLMSETTPVPLAEADFASLQALATLLAAALHTVPHAKAKPVKREAAVSLSRLTAREQQVFALLPRGLSNAEIGAQLGIAVGTAKVHMERILHKLGLKDRTQAAVRAAEWGHRA